MPRRTALLAALAGGLVVALVATAIVAVTASRRAAAQAERADELAAQVAQLEAEVAELEARADAGGGLEDLLGGSLGDQGTGAIEDLFGGGELDGLLDGLLSGVTGEVPGARCVAPADGGLGGLLDGGLGGLLGSGEPPPTDPDELVTTIAEQVAALRERDFARDVDVDLLDDDELTAELERLLDEDLDPERLAAQADVLGGLRAIPPGSDLAQLQRDLLEAQVAGFYVPEEERLVVRTPEGRVRPLDRVTLAHELDHALVDQVVGLPELDEGVDGDAALARLAVVEGDATLLMNRWTLEHLPLTDQLGMLGAGDLAGQAAQLEAFPHHLRRELVFPYTAGLDLVCDRWLDGGWDAVDAAYQDPPATTAEVLFPDLGALPPLDAPSLTTPPGGSPRFDDTFGAAPLLWLLEAPGGDPAAALDAPAERAAAWGAGHVRLWEVDGEPVVGLALRDRGGDGPDLCGTVTAWYAAAAPDATRRGGDGDVRFAGDDGVAAVRCDADAVRFAVAPTAELAGSVVDATGDAG